MDFIKKTELFFIQLQYCLTIEPEPILQVEKGIYSLMLKPDIFFKLTNDFQIEYPFIPENKIIELKGLMNKDGINKNDALKVIENYKKQYWVLDTVTIFEPVTDKLKRTLKSIDSNISEKEINIELNNFQKYLQVKRESIYIDLVNEIQSLSPPPAESKTDKLKAKLVKYGFFELPKVKQLSEPNKQSLVELLSTKGLPYSIAMFEYLDFLNHLKVEHFTSGEKLFAGIAKWFEVGERAVKGNINVLNKVSKENRTRYTADQHKEIAEKDYEVLK